MRDLHNNIRTMAVVSDSVIGNKTGIVIDRQGYGGVEFIASYGDITTTGTIVTLTVMEGDTVGALTAVAGSSLLGTEVLASRLSGAVTAGIGSAVTKRIGYVGNKRYVSVNVVQSGTVSTASFGILAVLHTPNNAPTLNP